MTDSWLPADPEPADVAKLGWWEPKAVTAWLGGKPPWDQMAYIVVDELHEGVAALVVNPWPRVDERGRLRFGSEEESVRVAARADALRELLCEDRTPVVDPTADDDVVETLKTRRLAIGDVFAASVLKPRTRRGADGDGGDGGDPSDGSPADPGSWIRGEILDITVQAREAAKAQAAAAAGGVMDEDLLAEIAAELGGDEPPPEPPPPPDEPPPEPSGRTGGPEAERKLELDLPDDEVATTREEVNRAIHELAGGED